MIVELLAFALVVLIGQFSPGPDMLLLTRTALEEGRKSGLFMVLGIVTGLAFQEWPCSSRKRAGLQL